MRRPLQVGDHLLRHLLQRDRVPVHPVLRPILRICVCVKRCVHQSVQLDDRFPPSGFALGIIQTIYVHARTPYLERVNDALRRAEVHVGDPQREDPVPVLGPLQARRASVAAHTFVGGILTGRRRSRQGRTHQFYSNRYVQINLYTHRLSGTSSKSGSAYEWEAAASRVAAEACRAARGCCPAAAAAAAPNSGRMPLLCAPPLARKHGAMLPVCLVVDYVRLSVCGMCIYKMCKTSKRHTYVWRWRRRPARPRGPMPGMPWCSVEGIWGGCRRTDDDVDVAMLLLRPQGSPVAYS